MGVAPYFWSTSGHYLWILAATSRAEESVAGVNESINVDKYFLGDSHGCS